MNKMYVYPPDQLVADIKEIAQKNKRSISETAVTLMEAAVKERKRLAEKDKKRGQKNQE